MTPASGEEKSWTLREVLAWTQQRFARQGLASPLLDAQLIVGKVLQLSKIQLYTEMERPLTVSERAEIKTLIQRRLTGEPVAYILGVKWWHDLELFVDKRVLIPRPETETLLDFVLQCWHGQPVSPRIIVDICTGSGCLAIALARAFPSATVVAIDLSPDALAVARLNAQRHGAENIVYQEADATSPGVYRELKAQHGNADVVVANPPYVSQQEWEACDAEVRVHEPRLALVADDEGRATGQKIWDHVREEGLMSDNSTFLMELGAGHPGWFVQRDGGGGKDERPYLQRQSLHEFPRKRLFALRDLAGKERFLGFLSGLLPTAFKPLGDFGTDLSEPQASLLDEIR